MLLLFLGGLFFKVVIVDDIGLSQNELQKLSELIKGRRNNTGQRQENREPATRNDNRNNNMQGNDNRNNNNMQGSDKKNNETRRYKIESRKVEEPNKGGNIMSKGNLRPLNKNEEIKKNDNQDNNLRPLYKEERNENSTQPNYGQGKREESPNENRYSNYPDNPRSQTSDQNLSNDDSQRQNNNPDEENNRDSGNSGQSYQTPRWSNNTNQNISPLSRNYNRPESYAPKNYYNDPENINNQNQEIPLKEETPDYNTPYSNRVPTSKNKIPDYNQAPLSKNDIPYNNRAPFLRNEFTNNNQVPLLNNDTPEYDTQLNNIRNQTPLSTRMMPNFDTRSNNVRDYSSAPPEPNIEVFTDEPVPSLPNSASFRPTRSPMNDDLHLNALAQHTTSEEPNLVVPSTSQIQSLDTPLTPTDPEDSLLYREKGNLLDAALAHKTLLEIKHNKSIKKEQSVDDEINNVSFKLEEIESKLKETRENYSVIKSNISYLKNKKISINSNRKQLKLDHDKTQAKIRLLESEIAHLMKRLDNLRSKIATMEGEKNVFSTRIRDLDNEIIKTQNMINVEDNKYLLRGKDLNAIDNIYNRLKIIMQELICRKTKEMNEQERIEMEKKRIEENYENYS